MMFGLKKNIGKLRGNFASVLLVLLFTTEAIFKYADFVFSKHILLSRFTKLAILMVIALIIVYKKKKTLILPCLLFFLYLIGQLHLYGNIPDYNIVAFSKYLYVILLLIFFTTLSDENNHELRFFNAFKQLIFFNSTLIILGFVFSINILKTYHGSRFGYNGLFSNSATSTYVYVIWLICIYKMNGVNSLSHVTNLIPFLALLLVGTKSLYLFFVGWLMIIVMFNVPKKIYRIGFLCLISIGLVIGVYLFFFKYGLFNEIRNSDGLISSIASYRNRLLMNRTIPFINNNWCEINYLVGGLGEPSTKSQIDLLDIFYVFGFLGGGIYLFMFFKEFSGINLSRGIIFMLLLLLIIVFLGGNFFAFASVGIYVVILRDLLRLNA